MGLFLNIGGKLPKRSVELQWFTGTVHPVPGRSKVFLNLVQRESTGWTEISSSENMRHQGVVIDVDVSWLNKNARLCDYDSKLLWNYDPAWPLGCVAAKAIIGMYSL